MTGRKRATCRMKVDNAQRRRRVGNIHWISTLAATVAWVRAAFPGLIHSVADVATIIQTLVSV